MPIPKVEVELLRREAGNSFLLTKWSVRARELPVAMLAKPLANAPAQRCQGAKLRGREIVAALRPVAFARIAYLNRVEASPVREYRGRLDVSNPCPGAKRDLF